MIVCKSCSYHNGDRDTFCGKCGGFLEWTGEKLAPPPAPVVADEEEEAPKRGFLARLQSALYVDVGDRPPVQTTPRPGAPGAPGAPGVPPRPGAPAPPGAPRPPGPPGAPKPPAPPAPPGAPKPPAPPAPPGAPKPPAPPAPPGAPKPPPPPSGAPKPPPPPGAPKPPAPPAPPSGAPKPPPPPGAAPTPPPPPSPPKPPPPPGGGSDGASLELPEARPPSDPRVSDSLLTAAAAKAAPKPPSAKETVPVSAEAAEARADAAGNLVVPVVPGDGQPEALLPQEVRKAPPPRKRPPTRKLQPGDLICGECGEGNSNTRKFCSRCGHSLAEAEQVKRPWWKRWLPAKGAKVRKSGDRPKGSRRGNSKAKEAFLSVFRVTRRVVALLLVVLGVVYGLSSQFRGWVNERALAVKAGAEKIIFQQYVPVAPVEITATSAIPDHPGILTFDGKSNTYWAAPQQGPEPTLVLRFDREVSVSKAIIRNGAAGDFQSQHRVQRLHFVFSTGRTADVDLKDNPDPQEVEIANGDGATSVEVHVTGVFRSVKGTDVTLSEIELFQKE